MKYQELQIEKQLLRSNIDTTSLNVLQRNSVTHLKETQENSYLFYHSIDQHQESLRLLIFSLLAKIYSAYSLLNVHRLQTLKNIVYTSPLSIEITDSRGIQRKQLLKLFAQKIKGLVIDSGVQVPLCNLMNSSVFFQEILLLGFQQAISSWLQEKKGGQKQTRELQLSEYMDFMRERFDIQFRVLPLTQVNAVEQENQVILYYVNDHLHKKSYKDIEISSVSSSSVKESQAKENNALLTLQSIKMNDTSKLEEMSPLHFSAKNKSSPNYSDRSGRKPLVEGSGQKKRRKKKQQESGSIFSLFCCCN